MASVKKGLPNHGKGFSQYKGNIKSESGKLPSGKRSPAKSGGKVKSSLTKTAVKGNPGRKA